MCYIFLIIFFSCYPILQHIFIFSTHYLSSITNNCQLFSLFSFFLFQRVFHVFFFLNIHEVFHFSFEIFNNITHIIYKISTLYETIIIGNNILFKFEDIKKQNLFKKNKL